MTQSLRYTLTCTGAVLLFLVASAAWAGGNVRVRQVPVADQELVDAGFFKVVTGKAAACCIPDGSVDDTLGMWSCCSGFAVSGSTVCSNPSDYGTTWASCRHVCGTAPVNGCIPSGGWDDTLGNTSCCNGAVPGSTWCLNPADYGTTWKSCVQKCQ